MGSVYGFVFVWWVQVLFLWPLFVTRTIIVKFYLPYICNTSSSTRQTTVCPLSSRHLAKGCGMAGPAVSHTNEGEWDSVLATPCWRRLLGWEDVRETNMFPAWMPPPTSRSGKERVAAESERLLLMANWHDSGTLVLEWSRYWSECWWYFMETKCSKKFPETN